jgi:hypothetical protein
MPPGIHNVFHSDLLRTAAIDPLELQETDDEQPEPIQVDGENEYSVEAILDHRTARRGRGAREELLVKWTGYAQPTWEPRVNFEDTVALDAYEASIGEEGGDVTG